MGGKAPLERIRVGRDIALPRRFCSSGRAGLGPCRHCSGFYACDSDRTIVEVLVGPWVDEQGLNQQKPG